MTGTRTGERAAGLLGWLARPRPATDAVRPDWMAELLRGLGDFVDEAEPRSFYCIANGDAVPVEAVRDRIGPRDVLCQYNGCRHAAALSGTPALSLLFFHMTERPGQIHGLDDGGVPVPGPHRAGSRICFVRNRAAQGDVPEVALPAFTLDSSRLEDLMVRSAPSTIPSAGLASVLALHLVNLLRGMGGRPPHRIVLCGFTGLYHGAAYLGHDFQSEQVILDMLPDVERLGGGSSAAASRLHHALAETFPRSYEGHRRSKADMLFDIGKLHFAAGDLPAFADFVRASAGLNPGFPQIQWLIRMLEEEPAADLGGLGDLTGGVEALRRNWQSGGGAAVVGASFRSEIEHPHAAYAVGTGERPRVLILNETAKMPFNRWHLGCELVSRTLADRLDRAGLDAVGWANSIGGLNRILAHDPEARFEGVVINGEGTLHDDADRAFEIGAMAQYLKGLGKKVFLVNTVWENNGARLAELARGLEIVSARESRSRDSLRRDGIAARLVPDLCWAADLPAPEGGGVAGDLAILDCVEAGRTDRLARVARLADLPMFVMDRFHDNFHRLLRAGARPELAPRVLRAADVRAARGWLGGRFHGVVLALGASVPILSVPSNTGKIEAMLGDIGLGGKTLAMADLDALGTRAAVEGLFTGPRAFDAADWRKVAAYRLEARKGIDQLFADIAAALA